MPSRPAINAGAPRATTPVQRCLAWLSTTSTVFPVAALAVAILSFATASPTLAILALLIVAVVPWALVAGGVDVPGVVLVGVSVLTSAWLFIHLDDRVAIFLVIVAISWSAAKGLRLAPLVGFFGAGGVPIISDAVNHEPFGDSGTLFWITGLAMGWFMGVVLDQQRQLTDDLSEARHELALAAIRDERTMVAREVHDIVGHSLTVVLLNIVGARRHLAKNPDATADALERAESVARESLETVRSVVGLLSNENQVYEPMPFGRDIVAVAEQARRSGLPISIEIVGDPAELEPAIGLTLVRLLQESLSNATRHAPGERIDIAVTVAAHDVTALVSNGLPATTHAASSSTRQGLGVASMRDRVAAVCGTLEVGTRDGRWLVRCVLPRTVPVT